jgi:hypothetical protein
LGFTYNVFMGFLVAQPQNPPSLCQFTDELDS